MALHFTISEYQQRIKAAIAAMQKNNLDGLLMFQQESMYYLTGYDSFGFCFFQCLYLGVDGKMALLTRSADLRQAQHTGELGDVQRFAGQQAQQPQPRLVAEEAQEG